jgi:Ras-related C3 botulinum toxin substrate 1
MKIVVVGDGAVGKSCLLLRYTSNSFPTAYVPAFGDNYAASAIVDGQQFVLQLWDTPGRSDYEKLRQLSYDTTDVFVIGFSLVDPSSLVNVEKLWVPEIKQHCPTAPYILVGTKSDLRDGFAEHASEEGYKGLEPIIAPLAEEMKRAVNAGAYVECSALEGHNVKEVFEAAVKAALQNDRQSSAPSPEPTQQSDGGGASDRCQVS